MVQYLKTVQISAEQRRCSGLPYTRICSASAVEEVSLMEEVRFVTEGPLDAFGSPSALRFLLQPCSSMRFHCRLHISTGDPPSGI